MCEEAVYCVKLLSMCIFMQSLLVMPAGWFMAVKVEVLCAVRHMSLNRIRRYRARMVIICVEGFSLNVDKYLFQVLYSSKSFTYITNGLMIVMIVS